MKWLGKTVIMFLIMSITDTGYAQGVTHQNIIADENLIVVQLAVDQSSTEENIEIYQHDGGYLVPLGFLTQFIDFPIEISADTLKASGWFITEKNNFTLDMNKRTVVLQGKETGLDTRMAIVGDNDIYVDSSLFSEWFPIDLELDFSRLILKLKPREKLPFQEIVERNNLRNRSIKSANKQNNYKKITTPPANLSTPFMDVELGNQFDNKTTPQNTSSYSILAQGDAAKLATNFFISGDTKDSLTSVRLSAGNKDKDANLLGNLKATEYLMGDIDSVALPLVSTRSRGRGVLISNFDLTRPDQFDQTSFIGDSQPGWEVEIYRNGELLDFQLIGDNGRYEFKDIPVLYGNNSFRIVSYGPQGQIKEETKNYSIDDSILQRNKFNYRVSADEKSQSLFGFDEQMQNIQHKKDGRFVGDFEYGLTDKITASAGIVSTPLEDGKIHDYNTLGIKSSAFGVLSSLNGAYDYTNNGYAAQGIFNTNIKDISTRLEHKRFYSFISEEELVTNSPHTSLTKLDFNGRFSKFISSGVSYGFGVLQEDFINGNNITTYTNRLATSLLGMGFANNLQWQTTENDSNNASLATGEFSIRGNYKKLFLRISTDYQMSPNALLQSVNLSIQKDLSERMNLRADIKQDVSNSNITSASLSLTKEFTAYRLSAVVSGDNTNNYMIGARLSFSFGKDSRDKKWFVKNKNIANTGAISASAFMDNNYNGIYDENDVVIENIGFKSGNQKYTAKEGAKSTLITGIDPYVLSDIEVNTTTIEDPFLAPSVKGYSVITRPGIITKINFPITYTTEIDGTVYNENNKPLSRAIVELVDSQGKVINSTKTEYDGFYIFSGVIPGDYNIRIAQETLNKLRTTHPAQSSIKILPKSDFVSGVDITINNTEHFTEE